MKVEWMKRKQTDLSEPYRLWLESEERKDAVSWIIWVDESRGDIGGKDRKSGGRHGG